MHFRIKLFFSQTLTQNTSSLGVSKDLKLFYKNQLFPKRHMHEDPFHATSNILDMAFISLGLSSRDIL